MSEFDDALALAKGSGNSFHARVARWLQENGWHVVISPYYMDQSQSKAREIDLIAEKHWLIEDRFRAPTFVVVVRLYVECKFVPSPSVFWFTEKDRAEAEEMVCRNGVFTPNNSYTLKHHYLATSPKVAKVFATKGGGTQENEPFYKALNQALNAMVSMQGRRTSIPELKGWAGAPELVLEFPLVVCSSFEKMFAVDFFAEPEPDPIRENFQLEVRYAYVGRDGVQRDDFFLLDFVEFGQLQSFVEAVETDARAGAFLSTA